jgi:hypothetical protein
MICDRAIPEKYRRAAKKFSRELTKWQSAVNHLILKEMPKVRGGFGSRGKCFWEKLSCLGTMAGLAYARSYYGGCPTTQKEGIMKNKIALLSLALASSVFALDEYMPLPPKTLEVDLGVSPLFFSGGYDADGEKVDAVGDPGATLVGLQLKYGVMAGLDVEFAWNYEKDNEDAGEAAGLLQPELGVKYAIGDMGLAVFGNLILPFATGDFDTDPSDLNLGIEPGVVYGKNYGKIQAVAKASYQLNLENGDDFKNGNILNVYLKPGYMVDDKLAAYLGIDYTSFGETEIAGTGMGDDGNLITLLPGATYVLSPEISFEGNVPLSVSGKNAAAFWGVGLFVYYTMPL